MPRGTTSIVFGENQLSPSLIGLSPLPTAHPNLFQQKRVRTSTRCYPSFILAMGRSLRFRVCGHALIFALFRLAFAAAPVHKTLTSRVTSNSPDHNAKGTQSAVPACADQPPTACRHTVSGSLSLAVRRSFHLSLTVLVHYRSRTSIQPWRVVPPDSSGVSRVPLYSGVRATRFGCLSPTGLSPCFARLPRRLRLDPKRERNKSRSDPTTPVPQGHRFGLVPFRSPLLRESRLISFPGDT